MLIFYLFLKNEKLVNRKCCIESWSALGPPQLYIFYQNVIEFFQVHY